MFRLKSATLIIAAVAAIAPHPASAQRDPLPNPDFTQGESIPEGATHQWNLGPTGLRGWMHGDHLETTKARQILVTEIAAGSPADGVIRKGDVILGVFGARFSYDARTEFGLAITRAEAGNGNLPLTIWRGGSTTQMNVPLAKLGAYSETAPFDCRKSAHILATGSKALAERIKDEGYPGTVNAITRSLNALALLATGESAYLPLVRREAEWASGFSSDSFETWWYPYAIMLLAEYQIATGDDAFQDGMRRLAMEAAEGQSIVGSWGHRFARPDGRLMGYGMMNAPGIPLTISLHMARLAGLDDPVIDRAIDRSAKLIRFYSGKGAPPYGDHQPWTQTHEDNGKSGMAAVMFNFLEEEEHSEFFARMSVASHGPERDTGHTGNFTNMLWAMPSISLAGPQATGGWMREFGAWYFDFARTWDFRFPHPGPPQKTPDSYNGWDVTGGYLLAYAMPLKKILLTGKQPTLVPQLDAPATESLLRDGRGWSNLNRTSAYDALSDAQLIERLGSWSPAVRERAAAAIVRRDGEKPVEILIAMLDSSNLYARYGAAETLKNLRGHAAPAVDALKAQLDHDDLWMRILAAEALSQIGEPAMSAAPKMLERIIMGPTEEDPRAMEQRFMSVAVFRHMLRNHPLDDIDPQLIHDAIVAGLQNQDGHARGTIGQFYDRLDLAQVEVLYPAIFEAVITPAPSGIMFAEGVREAGLRLLAKHHVESGIEATVAYLRTQNPWASEKRTPGILEILEAYGAHAQVVIPQLRETAEFFDQGEVDFPLRLSQDKARYVRESIARIEASTERPELRQFDSP